METLKEIVKDDITKVWTLLLKGQSETSEFDYQLELLRFAIECYQFEKEKVCLEESLA